MHFSGRQRIAVGKHKLFLIERLFRDDASQLSVYALFFVTNLHRFRPSVVNLSPEGTQSEKLD